MTAGFADARLNAFLNALRTGGSAMSAVTTAYAQIHTGDPGAAGTANVAAGSSTRSAISHTAASAAAMALTGTAPSWTNGGTSETITHISVWDASSGGNLQYTIALTASKAWASGDVLTLATCSLSMTPRAA